MTCENYHLPPPQLRYVETSSSSQAEKSAQLRAKAESDLNKAEAKLAELIVTQKMMEVDALGVVTAVEAAREKMVTLEAQLSTSSREYNELKVRKLTCFNVFFLIPLVLLVTIAVE